jgi:hypothetical protein
MPHDQELELRHLRVIDNHESNLLTNSDTALRIQPYRDFSLATGRDGPIESAHHGPSGRGHFLDPQLALADVPDLELMQKIAPVRHHPEIMHRLEYFEPAGLNGRRELVKPGFRQAAGVARFEERATDADDHH